MDARTIYDRIETGEAEACGAGPVIAALLATEGHAGRTCEILDMKNSGDVSGDLSSVVGYLSAAILAPEES
jgi:AmmeMemoRadiSam system protein B